MHGWGDGPDGFALSSRPHGNVNVMAISGSDLAALSVTIKPVLGEVLLNFFCNWVVS